MKRIFTVLLLCCLLLNLCACTSTNIGADDLTDMQGSSYYKWIGRFNLEKWKLNGTTLYADDYTEMGMHGDMYVILRKDYTATLALSLYSNDKPLEILEARYDYDITYDSGYFYIDGSSDRIRFEFHGDRLKFEFYGATLTFKKQ